MDSMEKAKTVSELTGGVIHDINNILTTIVGYSDIILNNKSSNNREQIEIIKRVALDGAEITKRIKDYIKPINKDKDEIFEISKVVKEAILITKPIWNNQMQINGKNIDLKFEGEEEIFIKGNKVEFREAIINLIFNGIDAIYSKGEITITTTRNSDFVIISIQDNGIGIENSIKDKIFTPFFTTKGEKGTGLGLSNVSRTIKEMAGKIEVNSIVNKGTEFIITIPLGEIDIHTKAIEKKELEKQSLRGLIIDDQYEICVVVKEMLSKINDGTIDIITKGLEALELVSKNSYDFIITDVAMPDINGIELIKSIKSINSKIVIGIMTGWDGYFKKDVVLKPDFILSKPFTMEELEEMLLIINNKIKNLVV